MIDYARGVAAGTAEAEQLPHRRSGRGLKRPTLAAIEELSRGVRTAFIADYLADPALRRKIHEVLQAARLP